MTLIPFIKMQGAGNDFVVIDNRIDRLRLEAKAAARLADRRTGIGCDQVIVLEPSQKADVLMRIFNADGSEISACGNASRCIGWKMMQEKDVDLVSIETKAGVLECKKFGDFMVTVDMGEPKWEWRDIPLSEPRNTEHLGIESHGLINPVAVNVGNPHMVFFVKDLDFVSFKESGAFLERHPLFPQRANVSAAQVLDHDHIRLKVWERGVGETLACGTAACATVVAGVRRGVCGRKATVSLPGGDLLIEWAQETNTIRMTGPVAEVFEGRFDKGLLV